MMSPKLNADRLLILSILVCALGLSGCATGGHGSSTPIESAPSASATPTGGAPQHDADSLVTADQLIGSWVGEETPGTPPGLGSGVTLDFDAAVEGVSPGMPTPATSAPSPNPGHSGMFRSAVMSCPAAWTESYAVVRGRLVLGLAAPIPAIGCIGETGEAKTTLSSFLTGSPTVTLSGDTLTLTGSSGTLTAHRRPTSSPTRQTTSSPTSIGTRTTAASDARAQLVGTWQVTDIAGRPSGATTTLWFRGGPDGQGSVSWPLADDPGWVKASFRASVGGCPAWSSDTYGVVEGRLRVGGPATYGVYDCTTDTGPDAERLADIVIGAPTITVGSDTLILSGTSGTVTARRTR